MRGLFVTATDTNVGKTVLSASLVAAIAAHGRGVRAFKPMLTGLEEPPAGVGQEDSRPDHEILAAAAGMSPEEVAPFRFAAAVSPHLAAALEGTSIDPSRLLAAARAGGGQQISIVEGVGGLLVPLSEDYTVRDLAADLGLPLLIASRPGLGTINHTLLTIAAARERGLEVTAVVLTPWPSQPTPMERSNRETIARLGEVEVATLEEVSSGEPSELVRAGDRLPWRRWLG